MLPSCQQIWPIFATWHFALYEVINITFNMLFNILNVYLSRRHQKPPFKFINVSMLWTVSLYTLIMALFMFAFSFDIHKRIREEKAHPVARAALRNTRFKRIFFWGICETNWKKRLPKFIVCCIVCCAIPVTLFFWFLCFIVSGPSSASPCTASSLWHLIGYDAWWKAMCTFVIVAVNYVACHNDEAPEVQPREASDSDMSKDGDGNEERENGDPAAIEVVSASCVTEDNSHEPQPEVSIAIQHRKPSRTLENESMPLLAAQASTAAAVRSYNQGEQSTPTTSMDSQRDDDKKDRDSLAALIIVRGCDADEHSNCENDGVELATSFSPVTSHADVTTLHNTHDDEDSCDRTCHIDSNSINHSGDSEQ